MSATTPPAIAPLVIGAPFGNYIQPRGATATLGTFTASRRGGVIARAWRVLSTVRFYPRMRAWVNRIGLRNPGIDWLSSRVLRGDIDVSDKLVSVHGFTPEDWYLLLDHIRTMRPLAVELNMSCPNVGHVDGPRDLFERAVATGVTVVVKVPPIAYSTMIDQAHAAGVTCFHCCNTLPVPGGGMSGQPLRPLSLQCIRDVRSRPYGRDLRIIGGGGIYQPSDIDEYARMGANHVAMASRLFHPVHLITHEPIRPFLERARELLGPPPQPASGTSR